MTWTIEEMRAHGMSEHEIKRATCEHDYGTMCMSSFLGCIRTCQKCGQKTGLNRNCWEHQAASSSGSEPR